MATIEEQNEIAIRAKQFKNKVNSLIEDEEERSKLFDALRNYLESKKVKRLVRDLKLVLDNSKKYPLFKEIRAFIEPEHLFAFDKLTEGARTGERIVHLKRHGNESLGFKFKGGLEHNVGIYVTSIMPGSAAHASGLRIGDEILKVNGFILHESIHDEVVNVLKNKRSLTFVTKNMGKIPNKVNNRIVWQEVDPHMKIANSGLWDSSFAAKALDSPMNARAKQSDDRLVALKVGKDGLGCSILSGIENFEGVYISVVTPNQLADNVGLKVGDQILQVNGRIFDNIKHSEAVDVLKSKKEFTMIVRHNEKVADYLIKKSKSKSEALKPILLTDGEDREGKKHATFGEELVIEYFEQKTLTEEEERILEEFHMAEDLPDAGEGNYQFDEKVVNGREVHFVSILKTAPLMLDLELKNEMVVVRSVTKGGAASDNGFLKRGDVLLDVEGIDLIGLSATEAQDAITEAMGRLSYHVDLIVACPPGRKPPEPQHLEEFLNRYSTPKSGQSGGSADSSDAEGDSMDSEKKSFVAKFIAQFESKSPKKNAFLKRRDSLEKARNSLRIYKERKRRGSLTKVHSPAQATMTSKLDSVDGHGRDGLGVAGSLDALSSSPQFGKRSAFAMHDPKPVNIASTAKQNWAAAVRKVSQSPLDATKGALVDDGNSPQLGLQRTRVGESPSASSNESNGVSSHSVSQSSTPSIASVQSSALSSQHLNKELRNSGNPVTGKAVAVRNDDYSNAEYIESHLSLNQQRVEALVHSPPRSVSSDDMLHSWAPTSPPRGYSASTENLTQRKSVAFNKVVTEIDQDENYLSPKSKSKSMDELNYRVEIFQQSNDRLQERKSDIPRKKSVGFKETVERIEPTTFKSLDDISMIGKTGWDEHMTRYEGKRHDVGMQAMPKKSALRSPSPMQVTGLNEREHESSYQRYLSPDSDKTSPQGDIYAGRGDPSQVRSAAVKGRGLVASNSLDDDPHLNEEMDRLATSVDPAFVIPEPDYEGYSGYVPAQSLPQQLAASKPPAPQPPAAHPKKKDASIGLTNRLLSNAKNKLKRVGFRRASQTTPNNERQDVHDKHSQASRPSPPTSKATLVKSHAPPPPPPPVPPAAFPPAPPPAPPPTSASNVGSSRSDLQMRLGSPITSPSPPPLAGLNEMILNSPVRQAAVARNYDELEKRGFKQAFQDGKDDFELEMNTSMNAAMASEMTEDVKIASVVAEYGSEPRHKQPPKVNRLVDMTDVLSELKVKSKQRTKRPISVHSETPSMHANSYSKDHGSRIQTGPASNVMSGHGTGKSSLDISPSKATPDMRESRISRRQARSVADIDMDSLDSSLTGLASNPVTPRNAQLVNAPDGNDGAFLEMEGTLKEFDDVIRSLDTEL